MVKMVEVVAAGSCKLMAQVVVSVVATAAAALIVPPLVDLAAPGFWTSAREKAAATRVAAPVDFEAAFVWPAATPPAELRDLDPPQATLPAVVPVPSRPERAAQALAAPAVAPTNRRPAAQRTGQAQAAALPATPPGQPLELAAMIAPKEPERRTLLGIPVPPLPYEQAVTGTLAKARDAVRNLF